MGIWYYFKKTIRNEVSGMKKLTWKYMQWQLSKSKKEMKKRRKENIARQKSARRKEEVTLSGYNSSRKYIGDSVIAPKVLSVFENSSETLSFFKNVSDKIRLQKYRGRIYFDLSNVVTVTVDAIMYLIATIKNTKRAKALNLEFSGNVPTDNDAKNIFETCGFYNYVSPQYNIQNSTHNKRISITHGREADPVLAGKICEFVHTCSNCDRLITKPLYTLIMELMTNTKQHAYNNNTRMENNWYVFVEDHKSYMYFVFLDTGAGIPNTIRTNGLLEKIKNTLNWDDSYFIASALRGELRSETKLDYRGQGLPEIYVKATSQYINDFSIISGYGKCSVHSTGEINKMQLSSELIGTILSWKIYKQ